jgi:hypothetical protein
MAYLDHSWVVQTQHPNYLGVLNKMSIPLVKSLRILRRSFPHIEQSPVFPNFRHQCSKRKPKWDFACPISKVKTLVLPD